MLIETQNLFRNISQRETDLREKEGTLSKAHSNEHFDHVAKDVQKVADIYGWDERVRELLDITARFHDGMRSPSEGTTEKISDEEASARKAGEILEQLDETGEFSTTPIERTAVCNTIRGHSNAPGRWLDPMMRNQDPVELQDMLDVALFTADKMDANGPVPRRFMFVAGERLREGDLQAFGFLPDQDEALVVALESFLRLSLINPEEIYPDKLKPLVGPLYNTQREVVAGVCKHLGLTIEDAAHLLYTKRRPDGRNMLEVRKYSFSDEGAVAQCIREKSGMSNEMIQQATDDQARSADEAVQYFSSNYEMNLDKAIKDWEPVGAYSKQWKQLM